MGLSPLTITLLVAIGLAVSVFVVRHSSYKQLGVKLTIWQSLKIIVIRSVVALTAGFGLGKLFSVAIGMGLLQSSILQEQPIILLCVVMTCATLSFFAYQWALNVLSGQSISIGSMLRTVVSESIFLILILLGLAVLFAVGQFLLS